MKRILIIVLAVCLISIPAWGNAASPYERPGDNAVFFDDDTGIILLEEWVKFTIGNYNWDSKVDVVYSLVNKDREDSSLEMLFVAPYLNEENVHVEMDGIEITDFEIKEAKEMPENWHASYTMKIKDPVDNRVLDRRLGGSRYLDRDGKVQGFQFEVNIEKGQEKELKISYTADEGYYSFDDVVNDINTQLYYLTPAKFWKGDPVVNLEIEFPNGGYKVYSNIELEKVSSTNYITRLSGLPEEEWTFGYVDTTGLVYGTNRRKVHNGITLGIIALTAIIGLRLRKRKKFQGTIVLLGIIAELFLFRPTYGTMFMIFYIGPVLLVVGGLAAGFIFLGKNISNKRKTHL